MAHYSITEACKLLGISITADNNEVQKRWRVVARKYHPDLHPNDPYAKSNFKKYRDAYEVINTYSSGMKVIASIEDEDAGYKFDGWLDELGITGARKEQIKREYEELERLDLEDE